MFYKEIVVKYYFKSHLNINSSIHSLNEERAHKSQSIRRWTRPRSRNHTRQEHPGTIGSRSLSLNYIHLKYDIHCVNDKLCKQFKRYFTLMRDESPDDNRRIPTNPFRRP